MVVEVHVLDAQANKFHDAKSGTVEQQAHEPDGSGEPLHDTLDFAGSENYGQTLGTFDADDLAEVARIA
jgi:hypothetical protein